MDEKELEKFKEEVRQATEKARIKNEKLSPEDDDKLTRSARIMEARQAYQSVSQEERDTTFFTYRAALPPTEKFTFFWATTSPFSQWHKCKFEASYINVPKPKTPSDNYTHKFSSAEQYMMYAKAMLFIDRETAGKILKAADPREIKNLGRSVQFFHEEVWDFNKVAIVYEGNKAKFSQNADLQKSLAATQGTTLVEAAPNDSIWGIGVTEDHPTAQARATWKGQNYLGEILTQLRFELMMKY